MFEHKTTILVTSLIAVPLLCLYFFPYFQPIERFNLDTQDLTLLKKLSNISELSYRSLKTIKNYPVEQGCLSPQAGNNKNSEMNWLVIECPNNVVIGVQGTANNKNIKIDLDYEPIYESHLGIKVHRGFNEAANNIYSQITNHIPGIFDKDKQYIFTGHSLGGATALLMGMRVKNTGRKVRVVTFGQPKITYYDDAGKYINFPLLRVVMLDDPITNNTKSLWYFIFNRPTYFGSLLILTGDQKYLALTEELLDSRSWDQKTVIIDNHYISNYIKELKQLKINSEKTYIDERFLVFDILYSPTNDFY